MIDWTDKHFRYFIRLLSPHTFLYTQMITTGALLHGEAERFLAFNKEEHPVALQVGGSDPAALGQVAKLAQDYGFDEINLNVGCPSDRVQAGKFGACLMKEPELVAECVAAMKAQCAIDVTVKTRLAVDEQEERESLFSFVEAVKKQGCKTFIVHARKAWLKGLSPKENRNVPPLNYSLVHELKAAHADLEIIINGGIDSVVAVDVQLNFVDGVMIGRQAYQNPIFFMQLEQHLFGGGDSQAPSLEDRITVINCYINYINLQLERGVRLSTLMRPIMCLFNGLDGAKQWRRYLSENGHKNNAGVEVVEQALAFF
jgi:tRNA-dihydrouridine synthase A